MVIIVSEWVSRLLTEHQHYIQCHSRWFMLENTGQKTNLKKNTDNTETKRNPEKARNAKHREQNYTLVLSPHTTLWLLIVIEAH